MENKTKTPHEDVSMVAAVEAVLVQGEPRRGRREGGCRLVYLELRLLWGTRWQHFPKSKQSGGTAPWAGQPQQLQAPT